MDELEGISTFVPPEIDDLNQWLPSYEFLDLIACGGMGAVYRARQVALDRLVAIKVLPPELAVDTVFRKSFEAEGKAMAKVSHSNLVGVFDLGEISDMLYLVIEFVEGSNLHESKGDSAIDPETAVSLVRSVASGLGEAHRLGLVHRDIKPANILINTELVPKLGDFGLAVPDSDIESGLMMGTPAYLGPEVMADPSSASFASDTYALGVILYEMLTGSSIEGGDVMDLARVPAIGNLPKIVRKAVDPKPLLRYQDGEAFEKALAEWLDKPKNSGLVVEPGVAPMRSSTAPKVNQGSSGSGLLIGLVILLLAGGIGWKMFGDKLGLGNSAEQEAMEAAALQEQREAALREEEAKEARALAELRESQKKSLAELSRGFSERRATLRKKFLEAAGEKGERFLSEAASGEPGIPRYFFTSEVDINDDLRRLLREFSIEQQEGQERKFEREISSLHRESVRDLRAARVEVSDSLEGSWEEWIEWLGENPVEAIRGSVAGQWALEGAPGPLVLNLSSSGENALTLGEERHEITIERDETGLMTVQYPKDVGFSFPWKLRWRGDRLDGVDEKGELRTLKLRKYDYSDLVVDEAFAGLDDRDIDYPKPDTDQFQDPELVKLTESYRNALKSKIEPLESGYLRVLNSAKESYAGGSEQEAVAMINDEIERVGEINWQEGFLRLQAIPPPAALPEELGKKYGIFRSEFAKRFGRLQATYLDALRKIKAKREAGEAADTSEVEGVINYLEMPAGVVQARFVKLVSLGGQGLTHTGIAEIEILGPEGEILPSRMFSGIEVSSFATNSVGAKAAGQLAVDGNVKTLWHSSLEGEGVKFPHWISFELGDDYEISGFTVTPLSIKAERKAGLTKWVFQVSPDGWNWTPVARGEFSMEAGKKVHLGLKKMRVE